MSLSTLAKELHLWIFRYLDHASLNTISKVSKYYRQASEPELYYTLEFNGVDVTSIKFLLLTLLRRPEVAGYIRSFAVFPGEILHFRQESPTRLQRLDMAESYICEILEEFETQCPLLESLVFEFAYKMNLTSSVALILYLAHNIESIDCSGVFVSPEEETNPLLDTLEYILKKGSIGANQSTKHVTRDQGHRPYARLRHLWSPEDISWQTFLRSTLETIRMEGCNISVRSKHSPIASNIRALALDHVHVNPSTLVDLITSGSLPCLTQLKLLEIDHKPDLFYQCPRICEAIGTRLPNLNHLKWTYSSYTSSELCPTKPLGSFSGLVNLKLLRIDYALLFGDKSSMLATLRNTVSVLPPNIEVLHVFNMPYARIDRLMALNDLGGIEQVLIHLTSVFTLSKVSIDLLSGHTPLPLVLPMVKVKLFLKQIADCLFHLGTHVSVSLEYIDLNISKNPVLRPWVGPGFMAQDREIYYVDRTGYYADREVYRAYGWV